MWDAVFVPNGFDSTIYFEQGKKFVPDADESPGADDPNFDMCKMLPFLVVLENWPCDTVGASFQTAMLTRDVIDQIVMDELADGKFDPGREMAERIAAGVAWNSDDGLRCHPMMKREVEFEYLDLDLLQTAAIGETTIKTMKERSSLAWKAR